VGHQALTQRVLGRDKQEQVLQTILKLHKPGNTRPQGSDDQKPTATKGKAEEL
jgi:hypothetical protein